MPRDCGGWNFSGKCRQFPSSVKSPHVGWNSLTVREGSRLLRGIAQDSFVYYTHSFQAPVVAATTAASEYGMPFSGGGRARQHFRSAVPSGEIGRRGARDSEEFLRGLTVLTKRIIACLDVDDGRVVKGVQFKNLRDAGDPAECAAAHARDGADEIVLLDITATSGNRQHDARRGLAHGALACLFRLRSAEEFASSRMPPRSSMRARTRSRSTRPQCATRR